MRVLFEEVVFDLPGVVVAELVSQLDLNEGVLKQFVFRPLGPGSRQLMFVEDSEFHDLIVRLLASKVGIGVSASNKISQ